MAFFVKMTPRNAALWMFLGLKEGVRTIIARVYGVPSREEGVVQFVEEHRLLHEGSVVVADNVGIFERSVHSYLDHVRRSEHYDTKHHKIPMEYEDRIADGVEVSVWHGAPSH